MKPPSKTVKIDRAVLEKTFDTAVNSMDFGSGMLDDEEVEALRAVAVVLGLDPMVGTPHGFQCKYGAPHRFTNWYKECQGLIDDPRQYIFYRYCENCRFRERETRDPKYETPLPLKVFGQKE